LFNGSFFFAVPGSILGISQGRIDGGRLIKVADQLKCGITAADPFPDGFKQLRLPDELVAAVPEYP
jgi:hypothetical protein